MPDRQSAGTVCECLEMQHNKGGMHGGEQKKKKYNDEKNWRNTARLQIQKGKVGIDMSKAGTTKYKTDSFSLCLFLSVSLSLSTPHTGNADPRESR